MIYIVVPYRARPNQLELFKNYIKTINKYQNEDINIQSLDNKIVTLIISQDNTQLFNRGLLLNIGVKILEKQFNIKDTDSIVLHDIDFHFKQHKIYNYYIKPQINTTYKLYCFNDSILSTIGGVALTTLPTFKNVNGLPNNFWGWGAEDTLFQYRHIYKNVNIDATFNSNPLNKDSQNDVISIILDNTDKKCKDIGIFHDNDSNNINTCKVNYEKNNPSLSVNNGYNKTQYIINSIIKCNIDNNFFIYNVSW